MELFPKLYPIVVLDRFKIAGRGLVFLTRRDLHDFDVLDLLNKIILVDDNAIDRNIPYKVTGIETHRLSERQVAQTVGLLVRKIECGP